MTPPDFSPLIVAGTLLGAGLGALLVDGIVLHQLLQVHNMLSGWYYPDTLQKAKFNMFFDGLFHAGTWVMICAGLALLWLAMGEKSVPRSTRALLGSMVFGFGLFNVIEGIVDHHLLGIHHVVEKSPNQFYWDMAFLTFGGLLFMMIGILHIQYARADVKGV